LLLHGKVCATEGARALGTSSRSLSRKLREAGVPFARILDELRQVLAKHYLSERELPVSEIAWLLGYREVSSFTHAFRRWTGTTPRQFRLQGDDAPARRKATAGRATQRRPGQFGVK